MAQKNNMHKGRGKYERIKYQAPLEFCISLYIAYMYKYLSIGMSPHTSTVETDHKAKCLRVALAARVAFNVGVAQSISISCTGTMYSLELCNRHQYNSS